MVNQFHLSAKEQIRLPNNHWFFGRRNCKVHLKKKPMVLKHRVMSHDWHAFSNQWFRGISSCLTTCVFQTNGFKASPRVSQLVFVFKPMVLSHHVESHKFRLWKNQWLMSAREWAREIQPMVLRRLVESHQFRLPKNQWLMYGFSVSPGNRLLKPMALRHRVESHESLPMVLMRFCPAAVSPGIVSRWDIKMAIKKRLPKNQWLISRRLIWLADRCKKWSINCICRAKEPIRLPKNQWLIGRRNCKVH